MSFDNGGSFEGFFAQQSIIPPPTGTPPILESFLATEFSASTTTHNVNMPPSVTAGHLILLLWTNDANDVPTPAGSWTQIYMTISGSVAQAALFAKTAVGTEGGTTVNVTTPTVEAAAAHVFVFSNWSGNLADVQAATVALTATSQTFACPALTPSYGAFPSYWLATIHGSTADVVSSGPTNYTDLVWTRGDPTTTGGQVGSARRASLTVTTETPDQFTMSASTTSDFITGTVAIKGA